jgi:hypothetical protein
VSTLRGETHLDRAPEVETIRRKLGELAAAGKAADLIMALARRHAAARPQALWFLYIHGHARAYFGTRNVQKMHIARLKFPAPATGETARAAASASISPLSQACIRSCQGGVSLIVTVVPGLSRWGTPRMVISSGVPSSMR